MSGHGAAERTHIDAKGLRVVIIAGTWHEVISDGLIAGAVRQLDASGATYSLVRVPGSGRKTAERLVIEMRDRLKGIGGAPPGGGSGLPTGTTPSPQAEAFSALVALGYKPAEVTRLLQKVDPAATSTEEMIRHALRAAAG